MYRRPVFIIPFAVIIFLSVLLLFHRAVLKWTIAKGAKEFLGLNLKIDRLTARFFRKRFTDYRTADFRARGL